MNKSIFFLLACTMLFSSVCAQTHRVMRYTYYDANRVHVKARYQVLDTIKNIAHGSYTTYFRNGNMKSRGHFEHNIPVGKWEFFYESGELKMTSLSLEDTQKHVFEVFYYKNGQKRREGTTYEHHREGMWKMYAEDGVLQSSVDYRNDIGKRIDYYPSGRISGKGLCNGVHKTGYWRYFAEDSTLSSEGLYEDGKKEDVWKSYYSSGSFASSGAYKNGKKTGLWEYFFEGGTVSSRGIYKDGKKYGTWQIFAPDGSLETLKVVGEDGKEDITMYYPTGEIKAKGSVENNKAHGKWFYFYRDGSKKGACDFIWGAGIYFGYYPDGRLQTKGHIEDNRNIGIWEVYDEDTPAKGDSLSLTDKPSVSSSSRTDPVNDSLVEEKISSEITKVHAVKKKNYFSSHFAEYKGVILQANPFFVFIGRLPIAIEFYNQDRLGYEFLFDLMRNPFFRSNNDMQQNEIFTRGYTIAMRQKFYNPFFKMGLWYFGHTIVFTGLSHSSSMPVNMQFTIASASEVKVEYGVLLGIRLMRNTGRNGLTLDAYTGFTLGYRKFTTSPVYQQIFSELNKKPFAYTFRFGINFGYALSVNR